MKWYLAGPMSGILDQNYPAFALACQELRAQGYTIISPHETTPFQRETDEPQWQALLKKDVITLLGCGGIALLSEWRGSKGATFEHHVAATVGMKIRYYRYKGLWINEVEGG